MAVFKAAVQSRTVSADCKHPCSVSNAVRSPVMWLLQHSLLTTVRELLKATTGDDSEQ